MRPTNPAVYECPRGKDKLHIWRRRPDGTAICLNCRTTLTLTEAAECFSD